MKTRLFAILVIATLMTACNNKLWDAIDDLNGKYSDLDGRVSQLEELCKQMNTNITSLQTLVSVIVNNDYIVTITPIMKENKEIGYTITFAIHDPITIYYGKDGKDGKDGLDGQNGTNGTDGQDAVTPIIGVKLDETDGAYYWTINGEWLLTPEGERVPVTARDGKSGKDGKDGEDGQDGKDGITPQLKIEEEYWYVSTDNGITWTQLGKATGEDGKDGKDGLNGKDGDSMFLSVTQDEEFVYFTLIDGTILTVKMGEKEEGVKIVDGAIMAEFSVSDSTKVYFSMGDLLYSEEGMHLCADGTTKPGTWKFAENQWCDTVENGWNNIFTWGSSGADISYPENAEISMEGAYRYLDWGQYNAIQNGGNKPETWRTLSPNEWEYLFNRSGGSMWTRADIYIDLQTCIHCILLFPDNYTPYLINHNKFISKDGYKDVYTLNIQLTELDKIQSNGVILLKFNNFYSDYPFIQSTSKFLLWSNKKPYGCQYAVNEQVFYDGSYNYYYTYDYISLYPTIVSSKISVRLAKNINKT